MIKEYENGLYVIMPEGVEVLNKIYSYLQINPHIDKNEPDIRSK